MKNLRSLSLGLAAIGLMTATLLVGWTGFGKIAHAVLSIGARGFGVFCLWQVLVFGLLGVTWQSIVPPSTGRPLLPFVVGRMVRDSAATCLPFSQVGGFVLGARAATLYGIKGSVATISMVVDLTAEFLSEILFAMGGLLIVLDAATSLTRIVPIGLGLGVAMVLGIAIGVTHRRLAPLFVHLVERIVGTWFNGGTVPDRVILMDLARQYSRSGRLSLATVLHLVGWVGKGIGNWIAFHLLGADIGILDALAIEGLLHALLIPAILIPGSIGAQEAGYAGIGALFGIPPELSIGVSLLRRARDVALGIPILLMWQFIEVRRLRAATLNPCDPT